jgi:hypothetical protein
METRQRAVVIGEEKYIECEKNERNIHARINDSDNSDCSSSTCGADFILFLADRRSDGQSKRK